MELNKTLFFVLTFGIGFGNTSLIERIYHNQSLVRGDGDIEFILGDIIKTQDHTTHIVFISKTYFMIENLSVIQLNHHVTFNHIKNINREMIRSNTNAMFLIDSTIMSDENLREIINHIRKFSGADVILIYNRKVPFTITNNIFFLVEEADSSLGITYNLYGICLYCNHGFDSLEKINKWIPQKGFKRSLSLTSNINKVNMHGYTLTFSCIVTPVLIFPIGVDNLGNTLWTGSEYNTLLLLGEIMNFKLKVHPLPSWGKVENGIATGVLGMVAYDKSDIGGGGLNVNGNRHKYVGYSPPIWPSKEVIITSKPPRGLKLFSFVQPFRPNVWLLFLISFPLSCLVLFTFNRCLKPAELAQSFSSYLWQVGQILLWDKTKVRGDKPFSETIYLGIYMVSTMILINIYLGVLTSFITLEPYKWPPVNSLEELEKSDLNWLTRDTVAIAEYLKDNEIMLKKKVDIPAEGILAAIVYALQKINDNPNRFAYIKAEVASKIVMASQFSDIEENHNFHFSREPVREIYNLFYLRKSAPHNRAIVLNLLKMTEHGILEHFNQKALEAFLTTARAMNKKQSRLPEKKQIDNVQFKHFRGTFLLFLMGYAISLIALALEKLISIFKIAH